MNPLQIVILLLVGLGGTAVVLVRDPLPQSLAAGIYGLLLAILFMVLQAPDVVLSELVVGAAAFPLMVMLTVAKTRGRGAE